VGDYTGRISTFTGDRFWGTTKEKCFPIISEHGDPELLNAKRLGSSVASSAYMSNFLFTIRIGPLPLVVQHAQQLKSALLPRMDGCAKTGKPDSDDWVRTCATQGQLYPQVQNLTQELQAL